MRRYLRARRRGYLRFTSGLIVMSVFGAVLLVPVTRHAVMATGAGAAAIRAYNLARPKLNLNNGPACFARLNDAGIDYLRLANWSDPAGCALDNTVRISKLGDAELSSPVMLTCRMAVLASAWEREALQPAAIAAFGSPVSRIDHLGSFNCRPIRGYKALLSEHAYANAIDIKSFTLKDGAKISVAKDWRNPGPRATLLKRVTKRACRYFSTVLSPDDNAQHANHLHFDAGVWHNC